MAIHQAENNHQLVKANKHSHNNQPPTKQRQPQEVYKQVLTKHQANKINTHNTHKHLVNHINKHKSQQRQPQQTRKQPHKLPTINQKPTLNKQKQTNSSQQTTLPQTHHSQ